MHLIDELLVAAEVSGALYTATVAATAVASVAARSPERRREARETLRLLLGGRERGA